MAEERYKLIVAKDYTEQYLRDMWNDAYCKQEIYTFDGIRVYFYDDNFDHAFYESTDRRQGIHKSKKKDVPSPRRLARFYWIKDVLRDPDADLYVGYESKTKSSHNLCGLFLPVLREWNCRLVVCKSPNRLPCG